MDFFTRFTRKKTPQNNFSRQTFSVENNYFTDVRENKSFRQLEYKNSFTQFFVLFGRSIRKWVASQKRGNNRRRSTQPTPNPHPSRGRVTSEASHEVAIFCLFITINFVSYHPAYHSSTVCLRFTSINNILRRKSSQFRIIQLLLILRPLCPRHG